MKLNLNLKLNLNWFRPSGIGVDLGTRSLKIVALERRNKHVFLKKCLVEDLREENFEGVQMRPRAESLKAMLETHGLLGKGAFVQLSDSKVQMTRFHLPVLPKNEIEQAVLNVIEVKFNANFTNSCIDYRLKEVTLNSQPKLEITAYVTAKDGVEQLLSEMSSVKLKPKAVENNMEAIGSCLFFNDYLPGDLYRWVIDMGEEMTSIGFFFASELLSVQTFPLAAGALLDRSAAQLKLRRWEAQEAFDSDEWSEEFENSIKPFLEDWSTQLSDKFYIVQEQFPGAQASEALLTGMGNRSEAFQQCLTQATGIPFRWVDPFRRIEFNHNELLSDERLVTGAPYMSTAVGLALRSVT